jgi:hypothetical protein
MLAVGPFTLIVSACHVCGSRIAAPWVWTDSKRMPLGFKKTEIREQR